SRTSLPYTTLFRSDLADHVEAGYQVGTTDAEEDAHGFTDVGFHLVGGGQGIHGAVEHHEFRTLVEQLLQRELLQAGRAVALCGVKLALHHAVLAIHLGQPTLRLDQDHAVHAVGDVLGDHGGGAVVHIQARRQRLEREALAVTGCYLGDRRTAAGAGDCMEVHRVDVRTVRGVLQV